MNKFVKILLTLVALLVVNIGFAQEVEMADTMRANGKIYVVVGIIVIILVGLIVYLFTIDKKISKLEKELDKNG
jgi:hypothetical protein